MTLELKITGTDFNDIKTQAAAIAGASTGGTGGGGGTTTPPTVDPNDPHLWDAAKITANYFPADPYTAIGVSPEDSTIAVAPDGTLQGRPYLVDHQKVVWSFAKGTDGKAVAGNNLGAPGWKLLIGNTAIHDYAQKDGSYTQAIIRQGQVYFLAATGQWQKVQAVDGPYSGCANVGNPPPAWSDKFIESYSPAGSGGGTGTTPPQPTIPMPPDPTPSAVAPGSSGKVLLVGPNQTYKTFQAASNAAQAGDTIKAGPELAGKTIIESFDINVPVILDGGLRLDFANIKAPTVTTQGVKLDGSSMAQPSGYSHQLGGIVMRADCIVRGFEVTGFGQKILIHDGTGGIRAGATGIFTIDHCHVHHNQNGIGPAQFQSNYTVTNCWFHDNGNAVLEGGAHEMYFSTGVVRVTMGPNVCSISPIAPNATANGGHALKSRANVTTIVGPAYFWSGDSSTVDFPDGSTQPNAIGSGVIIEKKAGDLHHSLITYAVEGTTNGLAGVNVAAGATIIANCTSPNVSSNGPITFAPGVVFQGTKITNTGSGTMTGV